MSLKKIECRYTNSEAIIQEYIQTTNKQNDIPIISVMILGILIGIRGMYANPNSATNYVWFGIAALMAFSELFSTKSRIAKRQMNRYQKKYGRINNKVEVTLGDKVYYSIDGHSISYKWRSIIGVNETENLLILSYPSEMIPLKKAGIRNVEIDQVRAFIKDHIAQDKELMEEEKVNRKSVRKQIRKEKRMNRMKQEKR
ncbi:hypothetical protein [Catenisphaera adipataccumulans]|jgi:hypothetical protein|uniref:YcxB-like protein domain-containing protein n=1 Tax=Catenisphaera adipataccumulans TaxID=700500 RepID=A0A7W8FV70_9FIRM|nr:hypothetical protein [Catenisphaera adipataccumulans]MBB5183324.1 hypothetical protein [Catenisphaera adipataccumulans]